MRYIILLLVLAIAVAACRKSSNNPTISAAVYKGTFQRKLADSSGTITPVAITFSGNNYERSAVEGAEVVYRYPVICNGTFQISGTDSIQFNNGCFFTADFDWTLILSGRYKVQTYNEGQSLVITRRYNNLYEDVYKLTRQN